MSLDLHTLHFASAVSRCAYVFVFLVMAISTRRQTYLWHWIVAMGASMTGSLIMMGIKPDELPGIPLSVVVYWLYGASLVLAWTGLRSFFSRTVNVWLGLSLAAMPGILYPIVIALGLSKRMALAAVFSCCLVPSVLSIYETVRVDPDRLWAKYIEVIAFSSYTTVFLISIAILLGTDLPIASAEGARSSMVIDQMMGVFIYFGFVAMSAERANRTLLRLAETDPLTGLLNRRGFKTMLDSRCPRLGKGQSAGVLILDIDHFKAINDTRGHEGGDIVLAEFADRLTAHIRPTDMIARWGGEEFIIVLPRIEANELLNIAQRLRRCIADQPFALPDGPLTATVSIGSSLVEYKGASFEEARKQADAALYKAKSQGRNCVRQANAINSENTSENQINASLSEYIQTGGEFLRLSCVPKSLRVR